MNNLEWLELELCYSGAPTISPSRASAIAAELRAASKLADAAQSWVDAQIPHALSPDLMTAYQGAKSALAAYRSAIEKGAGK